MKSRTVIILFLVPFCVGVLGWWAFSARASHQKEGAVVQTEEEPRPGSSLLMIDKYVFKDTKRVYLYPIVGDRYAPSRVRATTTVANADGATFSRLSAFTVASTSEGIHTYAYYKDTAHIFFFHDYDGIEGEENTLEVLADADVATFHSVEGGSTIDAQDKKFSYKAGKVVQ